MAAFIVNVLGDVESTLVTLGAESASLAMDFVWASACGAVRCVTGESFHDIKLVIAGEAGVGGNRSEVDLADKGRHCGL